MDNWRFQDFFTYKIRDEVARLPNLVFIFYSTETCPESWSALLDEVERLTRSKAGMWPSKPWYDRNGSGDYPFHSENLPHSQWGNPHNQKQLREIGEVGLLVSCDLPEEELRRVYGEPFDWSIMINSLPEMVGRIHWVLFDLTEDYVCFVTDPTRKDWIEKLRLWCAQRGVECHELCGPES